MLAIKECLIREGVLNLNPPNLSTNSTSYDAATSQYDVNTPYNLYRNRYSFGSNLNMLKMNNSPKKSATDISVNDLSSSNSATAKTSCQQQQQQSTQLESSIKPQTRKLPKRYQGHHPHFHHHTAPAYYTDLHLKIHTPEAKDSVNENYQSVYRTPSKLIKDEHQFPKATSSNLAAPLPFNPQTKLAPETPESVEGQHQGQFFQGAYSYNDPRQQQQQQQQNRNDPLYMPSSKRLQKPTKGNISSSPNFIVNEDHLNSNVPQPLADGSVVFACTNFKPCVTAEAELPPQNVTSGRSRNTQRFANRKRAVRVRSESRPISALYDIICKEKGLDIATTTTNDEDTSPSHSHDDEKAQSTHPPSRSRRSHSRSVSRQTKSSVASSQNSNMSGGVGNNSSGGDHPQHRSALQQKKRNEKYSPNSIFINDLSDDDDDDLQRLEGGCSRKNFRSRHAHKKVVNLAEDLLHAKSSSLPPGLINHNSHDSLADISKNKNNIKSSSNGSNAITSSNANHHAASQQSLNPSLSSNINTTTTLSVEPIHMHLSSSSLHDDTGAGTNNSSTVTATSSNHLLLQQPQDQHEFAANSDSLPKPAAVDSRYSRKHRRLRDDKPRRHTDGAIKLFPSELNDFDANDTNSQHHYHNDNNDQYVDDIYSDVDDYDQNYPSQFHDLNGAGHDFHSLTANAAANAKRYITRSQRVQQQQQITTNDTRSSPAVINSPILNATPQEQQKQQQQQQQDQQQDLNDPTTVTNTTTTSATTTTETTKQEALEEIKTVEETNGYTTTTIKTNGENKEQEEEMTNNSGKKSKTTTTATATTTKNIKDIKINHPLTTSDDVTATAPEEKTTTTTVDATCLSTTDKKKDEENKQRYTSPTSPKPQQLNQHKRPSSTCSDNPKYSGGSETEQYKMSSTNSSPTHRGNKKLIPSVSVSMKQNLSETQCTASRSNSLRLQTKSPKHKTAATTSSTECTVKITASPKVKAKSAHNQKVPQHLDDEIDADFLEIHDLPDENGSTVTRPRCSTMYTDSDKSKSSLSNGGQNDKLLEVNTVHKSRTSNRSPKRNEERDKSSKRKSNLNRALNEEATPDGDDSAMRRRRRREMGMARPLVPNDDASIKALISPHKTRVPSPTKPAIRNDLSYHMEMARRGLDLATNSERRRAQTASPKNIKDSPSPKSSNPPTRISKRSDTVAIGELRKDRSSVVNRKLNECTRTGLEEIMKIVENVSESSTNAPSAINDLSQTMKRLRESQEREREKEAESLNLPTSSNDEHQRKPSPVKHATFVQEERIYYEPDPSEHIDNGEGEHLNGGMLRSMRMLKAKSIERETAAYEPAKLSPILRRKSTDCPPTQANSSAATTNHIVSILKKKDHLSAGESSSASSNASPVTFSSNVMDTPSKQKRAGILKKRSSLDESRYYSRSHSPDERSILIKSARRNSLEEVANGSSSSSSAQGAAGHHGILKQSSYDSSKSDGCPSASREPLQPHSILKKKDSTSTPSDGGDHAPKHVSISQAVILAAAELSAAVETGDKFPNDDNFTPNNEEYDIKPILKLDSSTGDDSIKPPKPILKKKSSGDSDEHEIKPILKTSRKSSREEFEFAGYSDSETGQQDPPVKPILKTDSPSKRRSLGEPDGSNAQQEGEARETLSPFQLKRRTRSLERHDQAPVIDLAAALNAIATSQALPSELVSSLTNTTAGSNISVAERIKSVEKFLANQSGGQRMSACETSAVNTSWESPLQNDPNSSSNVAGGFKILKPSVIRRDLYKDRFKTQPVTSDEKNCFKSNINSSVNDTLPTGSAFKPAQSLEGLGFAHLSSHGNQSPNAPPSAFTLTRSFTQPLSTSLNSPPQSSSSFKIGVPVPVPRKSPPRSSLQLDNNSSVNAHNLTLSFTGDSGLSCNSNSERIFEMSSLEQDVDMPGENQEPKTPLNKDSSESSATSSSSGVVRTNSVRARANMFQQMQEKTVGNGGTSINREERTSPKRVPRRLSPSPAVNEDEPKTPNNPPLNPDDEIEPSSLPVSERLRFFSSLSEAGSKRNSCSFTRSPPFNSIERSSSVSSYHYYMATTPHSSTSLSSASVTPTPMEYPLPIFIESPTILRKTSNSSSTVANEVVTGNNETSHDFTDSRFAIKPDIVKTSPFLQATKQALPGHLAETETTPTSTLTPTMKRIKLKTIGKLMLPSTFLNNDRNNNNSKESSANKEPSSASESNGENENSGPPKKIGKIKSPFIENCNQKPQKSMQINTKSMKFDYNNKGQHNSLTALSSLENSSDHHNMDTSNGLSNGVSSQRKYQNTSLQTNGHYNNEDFSTDSGKENIDTSVKEHTTPVVEIRRKFTRKANTSQSFNNSTSSGVTTRQLTPRSASLNGPHSSSPKVDDKYAKYFGIATANKNNKSNQAPPPLPKQPPPTITPTNATPNNVQDQFGQQMEATPQQPLVMAINRNVRHTQCSSRGIKRQSSVCSINEVKKVKDIIVTEDELQKASKEFDKLFKDIVNEKSVGEFDKLFSRIV